VVHVPELPKRQHLHRPTGPREATEVLTGGPVAEGCGFQRPGWNDEQNEEEERVWERDFLIRSLLVEPVRSCVRV
jgi:hypothetical protein